MIGPILLELAGLLLVVAEVLFPSLGVFGTAAAACLVRRLGVLAADVEARVVLMEHEYTDRSVCCQALLGV